MPLSEHEQRLLEQMERALYAEDPGLASTLRGGPGRFGARGRLIAGILAVLGGLAVVVAGVAGNIPAVSVIGFLITLAGAYTMVRAVSAPAATAAAPSAPARKKSAGFMSRAEERFQRRRDEQQGF